LLKPNLLLVGKVGGNSGEGDRQILDIERAKHVPDAPEDFLPTYRAKAEARVHQPQHVEIVEGFNPGAVFVQLAGGIDPANHCAHGATGDTRNLVTPFRQFFDDPDVRISTRTSGAQYQRDFFAHAFLLLITRFGPGASAIKPAEK